MAEVLSQDEIDELLTAISSGEPENSFETAEAFEDYLTKRRKSHTEFLIMIYPFADSLVLIKMKIYWQILKEKMKNKDTEI